MLIDHINMLQGNQLILSEFRLEEVMHLPLELPHSRYHPRYHGRFLTRLQYLEASFPSVLTSVEHVRVPRMKQK